VLEWIKVVVRMVDGGATVVISGHKTQLEVRTCIHVFGPLGKQSPFHAIDHAEHEERGAVQKDLLFLHSSLKKGTIGGEIAQSAS
jgi:hypothetical protein